MLAESRDQLRNQDRDKIETEDYKIFITPPLSSPHIRSVSYTAQTKENNKEGETLSGKGYTACYATPTQTMTAVNWIHHFICLLLLIELCMSSILLLST